MIIITGVAGFIGSNIARNLNKTDILGIDDLSFGDIKNVPNNVSFVLQDFDKLLPLGGSAEDILIHCATSNIIYSIDHPIETFKNNAEKTIELFKRFRGRIIYTSTCSVYGNADILPTSEEATVKTYNAYDTSKRIAELYLMSRGGYTTLRLSNVYGEYQLASNPYCGVIGKLINCAFTGKTFELYGSAESTRDYTYIGDVAEAVQKAVERGSRLTEINIATGQETSVRELIRLVGQLTNKHINVKEVPPTPIDNITRRCLDFSKATKNLSWEPKTHLGEGLLKTIEWYKNAGYLSKIPSKVSE